MIIYCFVKPTVWKSITNLGKRALLGLVCCFFMAFGLLTLAEVQAFTNGDEVVLQNTFVGRYVRSERRIAAATLLGTILDGTRGTFLEGPRGGIGNNYTWYKVKWYTPHGELEGWTADSRDDCSYIAPAEEADKRDAITAKLFKLDPNSVDNVTNHDYYGYRCEPPDNLRRLGFGLHAGLDVQTKAGFDPNRNREFYSLTSGEVIRSDPGNRSTASVIAVYNASEDATVLYLHARTSYVGDGDLVEQGDLLGRQGNIGLFENDDKTRSHVHIEVREGEIDETAAGADHVNDNLYQDPVEYLFKWVSGEQRIEAVEPGEPEDDQTEDDVRIFTLIDNEDVNADGSVNIIDLLIVLSHRGENVKDFPDYDVNDDGRIDNEDVIEVIHALDAGAAPQATADNSFSFAGTPEEDALLPNYPNPFNPETWIPYQLAEAREVTITIYNAKGTIIRKLSLGHQAAGVYRSKSRAAYWDGRNELGEPAAGGVYFYTFTAGDFSATRKMLIRK